MDAVEEASVPLESSAPPSRETCEYSIDYEKSRFPFAIVWSPLPPLTWLLPFIGHMGICDSRGVIHDFAGPYTIGHVRGYKLFFCSPTRREGKANKLTPVDVS